MYRSKERGVALITALLVVALAVVAAASMASRQQLDIRRTGNLLHGEQAYAYVTGAENWARVVLERDLRDSTFDTLAEDWSTRPPASIVEGGMVTGCILDLQGRFNLNSLVDATGKFNPDAVDRYKRLLVGLDLDAELADTLVDWMDVDINARLAGAEDDYYLLQEPVYRAANRPMANLSELRLIKGYDAKAIALLEPHVSALPDPQTPLNVNTASAEALLTVAANLSLMDTQKIVDERELRPDGGFNDINDFASLTVLAGKPLDLTTLSIQSEWFALLATSYVGQGRAHLTAQVHRSTTGTEVVQRRREYADGLTCG